MLLIVGQKIICGELVNMNIQRLRTLTTGILHTSISDVYDDIEYITGIRVLTYQIPNILDAIAPWLKEKVVEDSFWNGEYNPNLSGEYDIKPMSEQDKLKYIYIQVTIDYEKAQ